MIMNEKKWWNIKWHYICANVHCKQYPQWHSGPDHFCINFLKDDSPFDIFKSLDRLFRILLPWYLIVLWPYVIVLNLGCMRSINSLNWYAIHFLINKLFIYKGDMSFKTLNISMAKIHKRDRYNVLFYALCNKIQYVSLKSVTLTVNIPYVRILITWIYPVVLQDWLYYINKTDNKVGSMEYIYNQGQLWNICWGSQWDKVVTRWQLAK